MLHGMWYLPGPGLEPVSPALAGRFLTTVPPGKSYILFFVCLFFKNLRQNCLLIPAVDLFHRMGLLLSLPDTIPLPLFCSVSLHMLCIDLNFISGEHEGIQKLGII